jgi:hypothetical protein
VLPPHATTAAISAAAKVKVVDDPTAPAVRFTREEGLGVSTFVHEELSDGLFDEINNVLDANTLLAKGLQKFLLGPQVYFRIYAERYHVKADHKQLKLLALTGLQEIYGPALYWLARLPAKELAEILREMCENPRIPNVYSAIRIMILLGPNATSWLNALWATRWKNYGQKPEFCWRMSEIVNRGTIANRRLSALRTMSGLVQEIADGDETHTIETLLNQPKLAADCLSKSCMNVFHGNKEERGLSRQLDLLAYGHEIESRSEEITQILIPARAMKKDA